MSEAPADETWLAEKERGSDLGIRVLIGVSRLGRRPVHFALAVACAYYVVFAGRARRASISYYRRLGVEAGWYTAYRHMLRFAQAAFDRIYVLSGQLDRFEVEHHGRDHLLSLIDKGQGAMLIGAHVGSFEVMRAAARAGGRMRVSILAHQGHAQRAARFLRQAADDEMRVRVIELDPKDPSYILEVKKRIEEGEFVAVMGDRVGVNDRSAEVDFLGSPARFPTGPYIAASLLKCPVLFVCGLLFSPSRYALHCEPFAERIELPRKAREAALQEYAQDYARRVERRCREAPDNWFNFYDFWNTSA